MAGNFVPDAALVEINGGSVRVRPLSGRSYQVSVTPQKPVRIGGMAYVAEDVVVASGGHYKVGTLRPFGTHVAGTWQTASREIVRSMADVLARAVAIAVQAHPALPLEGERAEIAAELAALTQHRERVRNGLEDKKDQAGFFADFVTRGRLNIGELSDLDREPLSVNVVSNRLGSVSIDQMSVGRFKVRARPGRYLVHSRFGREGEGAPAEIGADFDVECEVFFDKDTMVVDGASWVHVDRSKPPFPVPFCDFQQHVSSDLCEAFDGVVVVESHAFMQAALAEDESGLRRAAAGIAEFESLASTLDDEARSLLERMARLNEAIKALKASETSNVAPPGNGASPAR
jgi:hypothetical protein